MSNNNIDRETLVSYFAYGSNMNPERMKERGVTLYSRQALILPGYRLLFNKIVKTPNAGAANIIPDEQSVVEGVLYEITWDGIQNLDKHEHYPSEYDRVSLRLQYDETLEKEFLTYIANPHKTREGLKPLRTYLDHLLAAHDILSEEYHNKLKSVETLD